MKLDANILRYITKDEIRVLTAIEMGMKNHEIVPVQLIESIAKLKRGGTYKVLQSLLKYKLITHDRKKYDGYFLIYHGYDILALYTFYKRGFLKTIGTMIGTGKESDIYHCEDSEGRSCVIKLARLGRTSFRAVKDKRDYLGKRSKNNWLYLSRLASIREFSYMKALNDEGLPTPNPISHNRHAIMMTYLPAAPLINVKEMNDPEQVLNRCVKLAIKLLQLGLVHCDFNQFNLLVQDNGEVFVIDFPQMISADHAQAKELFYRDLECLNIYFSNRFSVEFEDFPNFEDIEVLRQLDQEVKASGFIKENLSKQELRDLDKLENRSEEEENKEDESSSSEEEKEEDDESEEDENEEDKNEDDENEEDKSQTCEEEISDCVHNQDLNEQIIQKESEEIVKSHEEQKTDKLRQENEDFINEETYEIDRKRSDDTEKTDKKEPRQTLTETDARTKLKLEKRNKVKLKSKNKNKGQINTGNLIN